MVGIKIKYLEIEKRKKLMINNMKGGNNKRW